MTPTNLDSYRVYLLTECGLKETTIAGYLAQLRLFDTWLAGRHPLADVPLNEVREYIRDRSRAGRKSRTIVQVVNAIRCYFRFVGRTDGRWLDMPRLDHREYLLPSEAEVTAQIKAASSLRDRAILTLLYSSGLRESELCSLQVKDVEDWCEGRIRVNGGKGGRDRIVFADTLALAHVWAYLDSRPQPLYTGDWIFPSTADAKRPIARDVVYQVVTRTAVAAGGRFHVTPHLCRKWFATTWLRKLRAMGFDGLAWVSRQLGHNDLESIKPYIISDKDERKAEHALRHPHERLARGEPAWVPLQGEYRPDRPPPGGVLSVGPAA